MVDFVLVALVSALLVLVARIVFARERRAVVFVACLLLAVLALWRGSSTGQGLGWSGPRAVPRSELARMRGEGGGPIWLAVAGRVYDVSGGRDHYGPGRGYSGFAGRDASRAFVDLCFSPECMERAHVLDEAWLSIKGNREAVEQWKKFYEDETDPKTGQKKYPYIGWVVEDDEKK